MKTSSTKSQKFCAGWVLCWLFDYLAFSWL